MWNRFASPQGEPSQVPAWDGGWNRRLGWVLLVVGFAAGTWLDPWSFRERDPAAWMSSHRPAVRHAQAVLVGMAFLQLIVAGLLTTCPFRPAVRQAASLLTGLGTLIYAAGYVFDPWWNASAWLIAAGALLNLLGFGLLAGDSIRSGFRPFLRMILLVFCFGMLLDALMGLFAADPDLFHPAYLGPEDGVRLRMLRLARAAVIALSLLTFLYRGLEIRTAWDRWLCRWGRIVLLVGAVGMPLILTAAAFISVQVKFLLPIPAFSTFAGTLAGVWLANRSGRPLETWGWLLIVLSMGAGLLMGLYAFDGPFPDPSFLGAYNDFPRRLSRLGHAYCIVLGLLSIFVSRLLEPGDKITWPRQLGVSLLVAASIVTLVMIALVGSWGVPVAVLGLGPAAVAVAIVLCLGLSKKERPDEIVGIRPVTSGL